MQLSAHTFVGVLAAAALGCAGCGPSNRARQDAPAASAESEFTNAATAAPTPVALHLKPATRYDYAFESKARAALGQGATLLDLELRGELQVVSVETSDKRVELQLSVANLVAKAAQSGAQAEADKLSEQLARPSFAEYAGGRLGALRMPATSSALAEAALRSLAAALQISPGAGQWQGTEADGTGAYVAAYKALPEAGAFEKVKLRYEPTPITGADPRARGALKPEVVRSTGKVTLKDGVLTEASSDEALAIDLGAQGTLRSSATLTMRLLRTAPAAGADWRALRAETVPREVLKTTASPEPSPALDDARIAGQSFEQVLATLVAKANGPRAELPVGSRNGEPIAEDERAEREQALAERTEPFQAMSAILRRRPEHLAQAVGLVKAGSPAARDLIWALGSAGTDAAQASLVVLASDPGLAKPVRKTVAFSLGRVARPSTASVQAFEGWLLDPTLRIVALYSVGTYARRLRVAGDTATSDRLSAGLLAALTAAKTDAERVETLRALFNAADPQAQAQLEAALASTSALVRAAALEALGRLQGARIDGLLAAAIVDDADASVRKTAIDAARTRVHSNELARAVEQAARKDTQVRCRARALDALGAWLPQHPELRPAIEAVATSDEREELRQTARRLLEG